MNAIPVVSVVVPLFNKAKYIEGCLGSVLLQTFCNFEVVVVDDGSTDGSGDIARSLGDSRIRVVEQPNRGEGAARNLGIASATAPLIAFLDADDTWAPGFLEAVVALSRQYPQAGILATGFRRCDEIGAGQETTLQHADSSVRKLIEDYFLQALDGDFVHSSSVAVPKWAFEQAGLFLEGEPTGCDRELWARVALQYPVAHDTRVFGRYNIGAEGRVCRIFAKSAKYPPVLRMLQSSLENGTVPPSQTGDVQRYMDHVLMNYTYGLIDSGRASEVPDLLHSHPFLTGRFQVEGRFLRLAALFLPARAIIALKYKPLRLISFLQRRFGLPVKAASTSRVITRVAQPGCL